MSWRWTARRWVISAFVIFHLSALVMWTIPQCAIKARCQSPYYYYVLPLGLWQWWAIFAPDPIRNTMVLDAEVVDAHGMRHTFEFPRLGDLTWWQRFPRYRNCKFTANMMIEEYKVHRTFTARHAVRELAKQHSLGEESFPLWVSLYLEVKDSPPPGTGVSDPMATSRIEVVDRFQFASLKEVRP
jgi:hypothetical protein